MPELLEAVAVIVTVPFAPAAHIAKPVWSIVATLRSEVAQLPE
jgi:hypothetical protein